MSVTKQFPKMHKHLHLLKCTHVHMDSLSFSLSGSRHTNKPVPWITLLACTENCANEYTLQSQGLVVPESELRVWRNLLLSCFVAWPLASHSSPVLIQELSLNFQLPEMLSRYSTLSNIYQGPDLDILRLLKSFLEFPLFLHSPLLHHQMLILTNAKSPLSI